MKGVCMKIIKSVICVLLLLLTSVFLVQCSGGGGGSSSSSSVEESNTAPVANAGIAQSCEVGDIVTLDGAASSDADGDSLTYAWSFTSRPAESTATLSSVNAVQPTFTPDFAGTYVVSLIVNDGGENSVAATVTVTVTESPLSEMYGLFTLHYKFDISSTVFTDQTNFSSANLNAAETTLLNFIIGHPHRAIACRRAPAFRSHMCVLLDSTYGTTELFLFNLNNGVISNGTYEYCFSGVSVEDCSDDLLTSPDGTAWGSVEPPDKSGTLFDESNIVSDNASKDALERDAGKAGMKVKGSSCQRQDDDKIITLTRELKSQVAGNLQ